jgi:hypothetical protein
VNGCPWDEYTFPSAACNGILENMKWLKENGCPWNERTFQDAVCNGNIENSNFTGTNYGITNGNSIKQDALNCDIINNNPDLVLQASRSNSCVSSALSSESSIHSDLAGAHHKGRRQAG